MNSVIGWVGGKRLLRKAILPRIPKHDTYCEPFAGAAWILFAKSRDHKEWQATKGQKYREILNDINGELVNFWRHVKHHPAALKAELDRLLASRELFHEFLDSASRTDLERAVRFYYVLACSYGSLSSTFAVRGHLTMLPIRRVGKLEAASERLRDVIIERLDFEAVIRKYDRPATFFYIDPPYYEREMLYERDKVAAFDQHEELAKLLREVQGKWLLSYNDHPAIRELYKGFTIDVVNTRYSVSGTNRESSEILIRNYE